MSAESKDLLDLRGQLYGKEIKNGRFWNTTITKVNVEVAKQLCEKNDPNGYIALASLAMGETISSDSSTPFPKDLISAYYFLQSALMCAHNVENSEEVTKIAKNALGDIGSIESKECRSEVIGAVKFSPWGRYEYYKNLKDLKENPRVVKPWDVFFGKAPCPCPNCAEKQEKGVSISESVQLK